LGPFFPRRSNRSRNPPVPKFSLRGDEETGGAGDQRPSAEQRVSAFKHPRARLGWLTRILPSASNQDRDGMDSILTVTLDGRRFGRTPTTGHTGAVKRLQRITFDLGPQKRRATTSRAYLVSCVVRRIGGRNSHPDSHRAPKPMQI